MPKQTYNPYDLRVKHGHSARGHISKTYVTWLNMLARCHNPRHPRFDYYGGKGIVVCARWREAFAHFLTDMGERPEGLTIDRWPNNDGNYEPGNCRWATRLQQARNQRNNKVITFNGVTGCLREVCEHFNANYTMIRDRLQSGWSVDRAFKTPKLKWWSRRL